jgi:ABC-2 type transport system ATP-binding protein
MAVIEVKSLYKAFRQGFWGKRNEVLKDLAFTLAEGEVYGFLGHNGSGKTTTIKLLLGLSRPDSGRISIFGSPQTADSRNRARIGFLSEEIGLYPYLNAAEMLRLVGSLFRLRGSDLSQRIDRLLDLVGLATGRSLKIKHYSKGMRQRLGIAAALINDPELLLLDEPYSGLDPVGRKHLRELLLSLKSQGKTILLSSHIVPDVEAVCDRVGILSGGKIARCLDLTEVYASETDEVEVTVAGMDSSRIIPSENDVEQVVTNECLTILRCRGAEKLKALITDVYKFDGSVLEVRPLKLSLEDIFVKETTGRSDIRTSGEVKKADEMAFTK